MENKIHFKSEKEVIEGLFFIVNTEEEYESLIKDYSQITGLNRSEIERRLEQNENFTANQTRF